MSQTNKSLIVLMVATLGLWGCAKGPATTSHAERIRTLEGKCVKLEDDYRSTAASRDQLRKHASALEAENVRLEKLRAMLAKEVQELKVVALERDVLQTRCDRLKKGLQNLLGQDDAMANPAPTTNPVSSAPPSPAMAGQS